MKATATSLEGVVPSRTAAGRGPLPHLHAMTAVFALAAPRFARRLARVMPRRTADTVVLAAAVTVGFTLIAVAERVRPFRREWNQPHDDTRADALHLVSSSLDGLAGQALAAAVATPVAAVLAGRGGAGRWPGRAPLPLRLALALALAELGHYWFHRVAHERASLWRVHAVHHSAPRLYWLNATRFHPLDLVPQIVLQVLPLLALGIDADAMLAYGVFSGIYGQVQHCNVEGDSGRFLARVFSTPESHRWHHSTDPAEGNSNYGAVLSIWDDVFGTALRPDRAFDAVVGIGGDPDFPTGWLDQMGAPFRSALPASG